MLYLYTETEKLGSLDCLR